MFQILFVVRYVNEQFCFLKRSFNNRLRDGRHRPFLDTNERYAATAARTRISPRHNGVFAFPAYVRGRCCWFGGQQCDDDICVIASIAPPAVRSTRRALKLVQDFVNFVVQFAVNHAYSIPALTSVL